MSWRLDKETDDVIGHATTLIIIKLESDGVEQKDKAR